MRGLRGLSETMIGGEEERTRQRTRRNAFQGEGAAEAKARRCVQRSAARAK